jgi:hypothetical protein
MVFDCSEASYDRVIELREIISKNNCSQNIILTHRLEADYLKDILIKNKNSLSALDMTLQDIDINQELSKQFKNSQGIPKLNKELKTQYNDIGEVIEEKIKNVNEKNIENNGYEGLETGMLDDLFK